MARRKVELALAILIASCLLWISAGTARARDGTAVSSTITPSTECAFLYGTKLPASRRTPCRRRSSIRAWTECVSNTSPKKGRRSATTPEEPRLRSAASGA